MLRNTLITLSDNKIGVDNNADNKADFYQASVLSATDYYAFGMSMKERSWQSEKYRYGFNGQERDRDIREDGNHTTAEFWEYDSRSGRRWNTDPKNYKYPMLSPYCVFYNNPIFNNDPLGDDVPPLHYTFFTTVAITMFDAAKVKGASDKGAVFVISQASVESGFAQSAIKYGDYNLFGTMTNGNDYKHTTSAGKVKDFSKVGGYTASMEYYFSHITRNQWEGMDLIKKTDFTSQDIDDAFNTGTDYATSKERYKGKYAYNNDMAADGKNYYGNAMYKQMETTKRRMVQALNYKINENHLSIQVLENSMKKDPNTFMTQLNQSKLGELASENIKLNDIKAKIQNVTL